MVGFIVATVRGASVGGFMTNASIKINSEISLVVPLLDHNLPEVSCLHHFLDRRVIHSTELMFMNF